MSKRSAKKAACREAADNMDSLIGNGAFEDNEAEHPGFLDAMNELIKELEHRGR